MGPLWVPGLRPGLPSYAPSGRWPLGEGGGFRAMGWPRRGAMRCVRGGRPEGAKHHSPGRSPGSGRPSQKKFKPRRGETHRRIAPSPFRGIFDGLPPVPFRGIPGGLGYAPPGVENWQKWARSGSQGFALGCHPVPLRGVEGSIPGLRSGLPSCAPLGRWPLGEGDGFWAEGWPRWGAMRCVRGGRPEGAKHHSPGRSPGSGRPSQKKFTPRRGETH